MQASKTRKPRPTANRNTAQIRKQQVDISASWLIHEIIATLTTGALIAVITWSAILGMSGNFQPEQEVVVGPIAEVDNDGR